MGIQENEAKHLLQYHQDDSAVFDSQLAGGSYVLSGAEGRRNSVEGSDW
jgi:hypothetical protein